MSTKAAQEAANENPAVAAGYPHKSTRKVACCDSIDHLYGPDTHTPHISREKYIYLIAENERLLNEVYRLTVDRNHWYTAANYSPAEIAEMRRKASYLQQNIDWSTGVVA